MGHDHPRGGTQAGLINARLQLKGGIELHYIERGAGAPLIFLHGGSGDYESWGPQIEAFCDSYRVIAYSRRYSHPNRNEVLVGEHSACIEAEDLGGLMRRLGLNRVHLVGTSYGAFTALMFALRQPQQVASLALAEPPVHSWAMDAVGGDVLYRRFTSDVWRPAGAAFRRRQPARAMQILADGMWGRPVFAAFSSRDRCAIMRNARAMQALVLSSDPFPKVARAGVRQLELPVLLIAGEYATALHRLVNRELARVLPNVREVTVPGASHGSPRENPGFFNATLREFYACFAQP
jgi:pimeloyl-ACP methyl ester carboxylesterase